MTPRILVSKADGRLVGGVAAIVFVFALLVALATSARIGPTFEELVRLHRIDQASGFLRTAAREGWWLAMGFDGGKPVQGNWDAMVLLAAWFRSALNHSDLMDPLTSARLPWILLSASGPVFLFLIVNREGSLLLAVWSALSLILLPRLTHGLGWGSDGATLVALALMLWWAHHKSTSGRRRWVVGLIAALIVGVGMSVALASLWGVVWILLALGLRFGRRGVRLPSWSVLALSFAPLLFILLRPGLWRGGPVGVSRELLSALSPSIRPTWFLGESFDALPVPWSFALVSLVWITPIAYLVFAVLGLVSAAWIKLTRRGAWGELEKMALVGVVLCVVMPGLWPDVFLLFPPRSELGCLVVVLLATAGVAGWRRKNARLLALPLVLTLGVMAMASLSSLGRGARFVGLAAGTPARVDAVKALELRDGTALQQVGLWLDQQGRPQVTLQTTAEVAAVLRRLAESKRMETQVVIAPRGAEFALVPGPARGRPIVQQFRQRGVVLWALMRLPH